jgi:hypothetical protein
MVLSRDGLAPMNRVMVRVPDISKPFAPAPIQFEEVRAEPWLTPEGGAPSFASCSRAFQSLKMVRIIQNGGT